MVEITIINNDKIKEIYPKLWSDVFEGRPIRMMPKELLVVGSLDDPIGYLAGSYMNKSKFYIQDSGILKKHRKKGWVKYFSKLVGYFKDSKIYTRTRNDNTQSMIILLKAGFKQIGCSIGDDNIFYIDWLKE